MKILFVCTGNTCRSPMAEYIAKRLFTEGFEFSSAGILANDGDRVSAGALQALQQMDIDANAHRARRITSEMLEQADKVLTMTKNHRLQLQINYSEYREKITTLGKAAGEESDVPDPFMQSDQIYTYTANKIEGLVKKAIKNIREKK